MSQLTHMIVCFWACGPRKAEENRVRELEVILERLGHNPLRQVDDYAGGERVFCPCVLLGCFNHLCVETLIEEFKKLKWDDFYYAWLMSENEDTAVWSEMVPLKPETPIENKKLAEQRDYWQRCIPNAVVSETFVVDDL